MDEVGGALIAIALTLCAVFVPSAFLSGISGLAGSLSGGGKSAGNATAVTAKAPASAKRRRMGEAPGG